MAHCPMSRNSLRTFDGLILFNLIVVALFLYQKDLRLLFKTNLINIFMNKKIFHTDVILIIIMCGITPFKNITKI